MSLIVIYAMVLIYFTISVWRFLLSIQRIIVKLSTVFIMVVARSEDISTSRPLSLLFNLLSSIEITRTFVNSSTYLFAASPLDGPGADGKVGKKLKKNNVEMG